MSLGLLTSPYPAIETLVGLKHPEVRLGSTWTRALLLRDIRGDHLNELVIEKVRSEN